MMDVHRDDDLSKGWGEGQSVEIAVFRPLVAFYTYLPPAGLRLHLGDLVEVPFGKRNVKGVVVNGGPRATGLSYELKTVAKVYSKEYRLPPESVALARWISSYYYCSLGEAFSAMGAPSPLQKTQVLTEQRTVRVGVRPVHRPSQALAIEEISQSLGQKPVLLHGITGSGKTEVYLHFIDQMLESGKSCLFLLPEITLTRETLRKLGSRYEDMLLYHSGMTLAQRRKTWLQSRCGGPYLIVGARSSLFCPVENLGLIVVDEEHDHSYKQDSTPRYQGRDLAVMKAIQAGAGIILGSATPSLESYHNTQIGKFTLVEMSERISSHPLPKVNVVDLGEERRELKRYGTIFLSREAEKKAKLALFKKQQVIFFLNRRGFSTAAVCPSCGNKVGCPHCSVALTHYRRSNLMMCHHCEYNSSVPQACPACHHSPLMFKGVGTEKIHDIVAQAFPGKSIVRIDGSIDGEKDIQEQLGRFMEGDGDILLGTQIISKGLDSPKITLSVALNADLGLSLPDFRAAERDFQLLTQLAGRVGRGDLAGECIFQAHDPNHYAIRHAIAQDYKSFFAEESSYRQQLSYPPYSRLGRVVFMHTREDILGKALGTLAPHLRAVAQVVGVTLLGPAPAPLQKVKTRYRWHLVAKSPTSAKLSRFLTGIMPYLQKMKNLEWFLDRDPQSTM